MTAKVEIFKEGQGPSEQTVYGRESFIAGGITAKVDGRSVPTTRFSFEGQNLHFFEKQEESFIMRGDIKEGSMTVHLHKEESLEVKDPDSNRIKVTHVSS